MYGWGPSEIDRLSVAEINYLMLKIKLDQTKRRARASHG